MASPSNPPSPFEQLMPIIFGKWMSLAVCALAKLDVPDHVDETPRSAEEIAQKIGARPDYLYRLMRATAALGVLAETPDHKFVQTPMSAILRSGAEPCLKHVAMFNADEWHMRGWGLLDHTVKTGERPLEKIWGMPIFEYLSKNPEAGANFHGGMTDMSTAQAPAVVHAYDFAGIKSLVDVGGGHGLLLATILHAHPEMTGVLFDQQFVIDGAAGGPTEAVKDRVKLVSGDMFESVPAGADAYIMKFIIHDWMDDACAKILKSCRAGVNPGGKLLVVDMVVPKPGEFHFSKVVDLEMMLFPSGKERTEEEFRDLFAQSGWKLTRVIPTFTPLSIVEGVPA